MAFGQPTVDFNYFLARKYAQLQQQADATTQNANSNAVQAATGAVVGNAAAALDTARATALPAESAAQIALQRAQARLVGEQASVVAPESRARIGQITAETGLTNTNNKIAIREGLTPRSFQLGGALSDVLGTTRISTAIGGLPSRRAGESEASYLDRINGF